MSVTLDLIVCFSSILLVLAGMFIGLLIGGWAEAIYHRWRDRHAYWNKDWR